MSEASIKIESQDLSIESLYKDFYTVPDFQREYVWQREQVEKLLEDVYDEFYDEEGQIIKGPEYFLGSIVVCKGDDGTLLLIDGQQRMTTIYLILCGIRDLLIEMNEEPNDTLKTQIASASTDDDGEEIFRHRLVLQYEDSQGILEQIVNADVYLNEISDKTTSVKRIYSAYQDIKEFLGVNCDTSPSSLRKLYAVFTKRVKLIRIVTPSLTNALKVFETVNDRGVGLNAMDLLKNLLFMKTLSSDYPKLKTQWEKLINILDKCKEKPLRFLRYYIMSHFELDSKKPLREDDIYDWFVKNTNITGLAENPLNFLKTLIECSEAWANFSMSKDVHGTSNPYLNNQSLLSGAARQHYILLLAGRHLPQELFSKLCRSIENFFFCYTITREPTKVFERNFGVWSRDLRIIQNEEELDNFFERRFISDMKRLSPRFGFAFEELNQSRIQQYRLRYILAKLTQYIEKKAWSNPAHENLEQYIASTVDIEHILPQTPNDLVRAAFDKQEQYEEYVAKLGNLTLLEKTINSSVSNGLYDEKLNGYQQSAFLLTKSLVEKPQVGVNTSLNRAVKNLLTFREWNSNSIESRQKMLATLARSVWDIPEQNTMEDGANE